MADFYVRRLLLHAVYDFLYAQSFDFELAPVSNVNEAICITLEIMGKG